ncbi:uncharacterized protein LOC143234993 isoform X2 [Tachypleus tridentatus]
MRTCAIFIFMTLITSICYETSLTADGAHNPRGFEAKKAPLIDLSGISSNFPADFSQQLRSFVQTVLGNILSRFNIPGFTNSTIPFLGKK